MSSEHAQSSHSDNGRRDSRPTGKSYGNRRDNNRGGNYGRNNGRNRRWDNDDNRGGKSMPRYNGNRDDNSRDGYYRGNRDDNEGRSNRNNRGSYGSNDRQDRGGRYNRDDRGYDKSRRDHEGRRDDKPRLNNGEQVIRRGRVESESGRWRQRSYAPQRSGYREERLNSRVEDPAVPADLDVRDLDPLVRQDLKVLSRDNAQAVAKHLIMAATWMADDPELALRHARAAKHRAGRIAVVRESNGIAAYHAGEWKEALSELRAARRMSGSDDFIAVMADCERGLGRPERALELARDVDTRGLPREVKIELLIVVAGARRELEQYDAAVTVLERANPDRNATDMEGIRLAYAYADALVARNAEGDKAEAAEWFAAIESHDLDALTDAEQRVAELKQD
ncbi:MAG: hypothetical protein Q3976_05790 [Corynebacterium sp.]|nr:hypothetical protein [Corynebacterium sp.]